MRAENAKQMRAENAKQMRAENAKQMRAENAEQMSVENADEGGESKTDDGGEDEGTSVKQTSVACANQMKVLHDYFIIKGRILQRHRTERQVGLNVSRH